MYVGDVYCQQQDMPAKRYLYCICTDAQCKCNSSCSLQNFKLCQNIHIHILLQNDFYIMQIMNRQTFIYVLIFANGFHGIVQLDGFINGVCRQL